MNRILSFGAALGIVLACAVGWAEATEYIYTTIDYSGADYTYVTGINDSGQIVGWYHLGDKSYSFTWSQGVFTPFDHPSAAYGGSGAYDINNLGQIVGWYDTRNALYVSAYLRDGDEYRTVAPLPGAWTEPEGISDSGSVVGWYRDAGGANRSFLYDGTSYMTIDDPEAITTYAKGINNAGVIVGSGWESAGYPHGFVRDADGTFSKFMVSGYPADANGINDLGQIVGDYGPSPDELYGYVLSDGIGSTPEMVSVPGITYTIPYDINNRGQVVGWYRNASGIEHGFLATPIAAADFDKDGDVDGADLALWQGDYGVSANCDADGDGDTDGQDFLVWQRQYIAGVPGLANELSIPEPASLLLALMALAASVRVAPKRGDHM
jgi:probable HAF family extracellular repeat protein